MQPTRTMRLEALLYLINRIYARRRSTGRRTDHLIPRSQLLSRAYLDSRHADLTASSTAH